MLVGLQSFMYEESNAIGSLSVSQAERERLAAASHAFNQRNQIWRDVFGGGASAAAAAAAGGAAGGADGEVEKEQESVCRFCFTAGGELLSPCMCKVGMRLEKAFHFID